MRGKNIVALLRFIALGAIICIFVGMLAGCGGKSWVCDYCGKKFSGTAYYAYSLDDTLCEECAWDYWIPLPIENYKKK